MSKRRRNLTIVTAIFLALAVVAGIAFKLADVRAATRAQELLEEADSYRALGLWYEAKPRYEAVIRTYPYNGNAIRAKLGLAGCLEVTDPNTAVAWYEEVAAAGVDADTEANALLRRADTLRRIDVNAALAEFDSLKARYPGAVHGHRAELGLAECFQTQGLYPEAENAYRRVAKAAAGTPVAPEALYKLALCMYGSGNWGEPPPGQREVLEEALADPNVALEVWCELKWLLAVGYLKQGDDPAAKRVLYELTVQAPNTVRGLRELASLAALELGDGGLPACRAALQRALAEAPGTLVARGAEELLWLLDQPELWADPNDVAPLLLGLRAQFYWFVDKALAERALRALADQCPDLEFVPNALESLAEILFKNKDYPASAEVFVQLANNYPGAPEAAEALWCRALCYGRIGQWADSIAAYQEGIDRYPGNHIAAVCQYGIGRVYEMHLHEREPAVAAYGEVVATYPGTDQARYAQEALERLGNS